MPAWHCTGQNPCRLGSQSRPSPHDPPHRGQGWRVAPAHAGPARQPEGVVVSGGPGAPRCRPASDRRQAVRRLLQRKQCHFSGSASQGCWWCTSLPPFRPLLSTAQSLAAVNTNKDQGRVLCAQGIKPFRVPASAGQLPLFADRLHPASQERAESRDPLDGAEHWFDVHFRRAKTTRPSAVNKQCGCCLEGQTLWSKPRKVGTKLNGNCWKHS